MLRIYSYNMLGEGIIYVLKIQGIERRLKKEEMKNSRLFVVTFVVLALAISILNFVSAVQPFGVETLTEGASTRAPVASPENHSAIAGNVTELTIAGTSITQAWQGYFWNVTGTIQLADSSDNVMYDWALADPEGEVYASTSGTIDWASIACFDLDTNHEALETLFGIENDAVDGINETFFNTNDHDLFYTNNVQFSIGDCATAFIYDDTNGPVDNHFEEVLMTDQSAATQVIFASIIEEASVLGFDDRDHDFEMLVLEDGHGTDLATTTYYFYVELE